MSGSGVRIDRDGPVATVTLCRPNVLNAQTPAMWRELRRIAADLPGDIRVVVVRGEGRAFSAGLDLSAVVGLGSGGDDADPARAEPADAGADSAGADAGAKLDVGALARGDDVASYAEIAGFQAAFGWLRRPDLASIAAVRGHAIGAGFQLALACDLRVLTEDAKLTMAEVTLGLVPDLGGTKRLVELVGYARAFEICATGRRVDAAEAERIGLANRVVPADGLDAAVAELVEALLVVPRDAVVEIKALLAGASGRDFPAQEAAEREAQLRRLRDLVGLGE